MQEGDRLSDVEIDPWLIVTQPDAEVYRILSDITQIMHLGVEVFGPADTEAGRQQQLEEVLGVLQQRMMVPKPRVWGEKLKQFIRERRAEGMPMYQVAKRFRTPRITIWRIENGRVEEQGGKKNGQLAASSPDRDL